MAYQVEFELSTEGHNNVWEAHGDLVRQAIIPDSDVISAKLLRRTNDLNWPILQVKFSTSDAAKAYTAAYLGYASQDPNSMSKDELESIEREVREFISSGKHVYCPF